MEPFDPNDAVHRALRQLPHPRAPHTLLPRVMAAVGERQAAQTWFTWPLAWRLASVAALALVVAGAVWIWPSAHGGVSAVLSSGPALALWRYAASAVDSVIVAAGVTSIVWQTFMEPIVGYLLVWIVLMSAACAGFAAMLGRVALGGASHS
jgi:hypothetical protein